MNYSMLSVNEIISTIIRTVRRMIVNKCRFVGCIILEENEKFVGRKIGGISTRKAFANGVLKRTSVDSNKN